ncbi:MAG: exodeoxyribonuclease VII large subunit [Bacteroidales bacterium]
MKTEGKQIGLVELQEQIKDSVEGVYKEHIWVCAEISEIKNHPSGHCYLTLIEKDKDGDGVSAKAAAIIWSSSYRVVRP